MKKYDAGMPAEPPEISFSTFDWSLLPLSNSAKARALEGTLAVRRALHEIEHDSSPVCSLEWLKVHYPKRASSLVEGIRRHLSTLRTSNLTGVPGSNTTSGDLMVEVMAGSIVLGWARAAREPGKMGGSEMGPPGLR